MQLGQEQPGSCEQPFSSQVQQLHTSPSTPVHPSTHPSQQQPLSHTHLSQVQSSLLGTVGHTHSSQEQLDTGGKSLRVANHGQNAQKAPQKITNDTLTVSFLNIIVSI